MAISFASFRAKQRFPFKVHNLFVDGGVAAGGTPKYPLLGLNPTEPPTNTAEGGVYYDDDAHTLKVYNGSSYVDAGGVNIAAFKLAPASTVTEYDLMVALRPFVVVGISVVPSTLQGGALTATVVKATGTSAPAKGTTPLHTADSINLNTGAYTVQAVTLTSTAADLVFATGDRLGIDYSAAYTTGHAALTISYVYV